MMSGLRAEWHSHGAPDEREGNGRSIRRAYDLNGVTLAIVASEERYATFLEPILAPLRCATSVAHDWSALMLPASTICPPNGGLRIFDGSLPEGLPALMVEDGQGRILVVPDHFAMRFRRKSQTTEIHFVPGKEGALSGTAAFWMLDDLLAAHGRHLLHGALLVDPRTERSVVLFAPSGTGKTTTALALARSGFCLAGDDALVLDSSGDGHGLWAIPRRIKVDRKAATLLPWLGPVLTDSWVNDEQAFELDALSPVVTLATPRRRKVGLVIALMSPNPVGHSVVPAGKPETLAAIACDNLRIAPGGVDADNAATLAALARVIAATPVIKLSVGPDPGSLSRALIGLA
jgi:hypothetical protein